MLSDLYHYKLNTKELFSSISAIDEDGNFRSLVRDIFFPPVIGALKKVLHGHTSAEKLNFIASELPYIPKKDAREVIGGIPNVVSRKVTREAAAELSDYSFLNQIDSFIDYFQIVIGATLRTVSYIGPFRASSQRFNRIQELAVNRIDSTGANTAMYLYSLGQKELESFNSLMEKACGFIVDVKGSGPGHITVNIGKRSTGHFENIADVGFGFSQLLPVIAQMHSLIEGSQSARRYPFLSQRVFAVEQPELHLHPALQKNLADLFVEAFANNSNSQSSFAGVLETHSQSMVQRFGELVALGALSPNDISLVYIEKDEGGEFSTARQMTFNDDGLIEDWPIGFFTV